MHAPAAGFGRHGGEAVRGDHVLDVHDGQAVGGDAGPEGAAEDVGHDAHRLAAHLRCVRTRALWVSG